MCIAGETNPDTCGHVKFCNRNNRICVDRAANIGKILPCQRNDRISDHIAASK